MSTIFLNQRLEETHERRSGNTTRLVDFTIQNLFNGNQCLILFNYTAELEDFEKRLHKRMTIEHHSAMTVKDRFALWDDMERGKSYRMVYTRINPTSTEALRGKHFKDKDDKDTAMIDLLNLTKVPFLNIELQYK